MMEYCRLCAELKDINEIAASISDVDRLMEQKLRACCQWTEENTEHRLPHSVCSICFDKLEKSWLFSECVQLAQQRLLEIFVHETQDATNVKAELDLELTKTEVDFTEFMENDLPQTIAMELPAAICYESYDHQNTREDLRAHCKDQIRNECENCSEEFCTALDLAAHRHERCKRQQQQRRMENGEELLAESDGGFDKRVAERAKAKAKIRKYQVSQCEICLKFFTQKSALNLHLRTVHDLRNLFKCDECGESFEYRRELVAHNKTIHVTVTADNRYQCPSCDQTFSKMFDLRSHRSNKHAKEFPCDFCDMIFSVRSDLLEHRNVHADQMLKCEQCDRRFWTKRNLHIHIRYIHLKIRRFECTECDKRCATRANYFWSSRDLRNHMKSHHPESMAMENYECWCCHKTFLTEHLLKKHIKKHRMTDLRSERQQQQQQQQLIENDEEMHGRLADDGLDGRAEKNNETKTKIRKSNHHTAQCEHCLKMFTQKSALYLHLRTVHDLRDIFKCDDCGEKFQYRRELVAHSVTHVTVTANNRYQCPSCDQTFSKIFDLRWHRTNIHADEFPCDFCDMIFSARSDLLEHRNVHTDQMYKCEHCDRHFWTQWNLRQHVSYTHLKVREIECDKCDKRFITTRDLRKHMKSHREKYECWCCHKTFLAGGVLRKHMRLCHVADPSESRCICELCGMHFKQMGALMNHMKHLHSNERPFKCHHCGLGFKCKQILKRHLDVHADSQFKCSQCDKVFRSKENLKRHMPYHSEVKPHKCDFCEKSFREKADLKNHRRIHTGERPYTCEHCTSNFRAASSYYAHLRKTHGISKLAQNLEKRFQEANTSQS